MDDQPTVPQISETPWIDARWTVADLIDLEYYLEADEQLLREQPAARATLTERDRAIYLEQIAPAVAGAEPHHPLHRRASLFNWLLARRASEDPKLRPLLPGDAVTAAERMATLVLAILGGILGMSTASSLLKYDGHLPISVTWYLFILVGIQLFLVTTAIVAWLRRGVGRGHGLQRESWILARVVRPFLINLAHWLQQQRLGQVGEEIRQRALMTKGLLQSHIIVYGPLSYLPLLIVAQVFGVAFNLGVIVNTLALESFTDLAFGWETSLAAQPQMIHDLVRGLATPWSWLFGEGTGYPTLSEVAGSRVNLAQWASSSSGSIMDPEALRSWRWFLVLAVITYGLLPRLILLFASRIAQKIALARLSFTHGRPQALYARLLTPHLETATRTPKIAGPAMPIPEQIKPRTETNNLILNQEVKSNPRPWRDSPESITQTKQINPASTSIEDTKVVTDSNPQQSSNKPLFARRAAGKKSNITLISPGVSNTSNQLNSTNNNSKPELIIPENSDTSLNLITQEIIPAINPEPNKTNQQDKDIPENLITETRTRFAPNACLLLIHVDIDDVLQPEDHLRLESLIQTLCGWRPETTTLFGAGSAMTTRVLKILEQSEWQAPPPRIVLLQDGSQPPITEQLLFLRELRAAAGTRAQIVLTLVGDPEEHDRLPPLRAFDLTDWQRKIDQLTDPYLRLETLVTNHAHGDNS